MNDDARARADEGFSCNAVLLHTHTKLSSEALRDLMCIYMEIHDVMQALRIVFCVVYTLLLYEHIHIHV